MVMKPLYHLSVPSSNHHTRQPLHFRFHCHYYW